MVIVLVTQGKGDSRPDKAKIIQFYYEGEANEYIASVETGRSEYWTKAEIVPSCEFVDLAWPE